MKHITLIILMSLLCLWSCTATHSVRTVGKGNGAVEASFGGPIFTDMGGPIPAPNLFIGGRYGVQEDMDVLLHYNLTTPIVPGIGLDLIGGVQYVPIQPGVGMQRDTKVSGWSLSTKGTFHLLTDFVNGAIALPDFELAGGYRYRWLNPYLGVSLALHFFRPYDEVSPVFLSPFVGMDAIINDRVSIGLRVTFFDVTHNMWGSQVTWIHLLNDSTDHQKYGMLGLTLGFSYDILKKATRKSKGGVQ